MTQLFGTPSELLDGQALTEREAERQFFAALDRADYRHNFKNFTSACTETVDEYVDRLAREREFADSLALQDNLDSKEEWS